MYDEKKIDVQCIHHYTYLIFSLSDYNIKKKKKNESFQQKKNPIICKAVIFEVK